MVAPERRGTGSTDTAALSAGAIAVVVSLFITPGSYGIVNLLISLTLVLVIFAYVWPHARRFLQSAAVGAAVGLASLPGIGFFGEVAGSTKPIQQLLGYYEWNCDVDPCREKVPRSRVEDWHLALGWLVITAIVLAADRAFQRHRKPD
jgi:hypothetical protein